MTHIEILKIMIEEYDKRGCGYSQYVALKEAVEIMQKFKNRSVFSAMDKDKINSMGIPLTSAQWKEIDFIILSQNNRIKLLELAIKNANKALADKCDEFDRYVKTNQKEDKIKVLDDEVFGRNGYIKESDIEICDYVIDDGTGSSCNFDVCKKCKSYNNEG
ncbi:MAG: hypothetical protein M0R03_20865 [Novosphingobium sp.]|nr:hypothetical protein [Novosphingobium sp.]